MHIAELLLPEFDNEMTVTRRILERVPDGKGEWKPHEKAFPMGHLAQLVARLPSWINLVTEQTEFDIAPVGKPAYPPYSIETTAVLLELFDRNVAGARPALERASDEAYMAQWTFKRAGQTLYTKSRYEMIRFMTLNHIVHHRAQLGLYLRILDEKVPQMYGPTADDRG